MKALVRFLTVPAIFCFLSISSQAQFVQTADEISLFQATNIQNTPASPVRGVSDDGKRVVFESPANITGDNPDFNLEVFVYEVDKRTFVQLTKTEHVYDPADKDKPFAERKILITVSNNNAVISGDGTKIAFSSNSGTLISGDAGKNDDGNQEIYLATLAANSTTPSFQRITTTAASTKASAQTEVFDNYTPTINSNGSIIAFVTNRKELQGVTNPDGLGQIVLYRPATGQFTQVTTKNEVDGLDGFIFKGFNANPQLSGNGNVMVFISGFDHAPTTSVNNKDFNSEIFLYDVAARTTTQLTNTTGFAGFPATISQIGTLIPDRPMNIFTLNTKHLSNDGNLLVFESAGDFESGKNTDKTREVFLYNRTANKFTQITSNSPLPSTPTQTDIDKIDYDFTPAISPDGRYIFIGSILNIVPVASGGTSGILTDNADGSREVFRYDIAAAKFRQITYTPLSPRVLDQREATVQVNSNATGTDLFFTNDINMIGENPDTSFEIYRALIRPVTETNSVVPAMVNAASFLSPDATKPETNPVARGAIASIFGTRIADASAISTRTDLDYELNGVSVTVQGIAARLFYVSALQLNFLMPDGVVPGDGVEFTINNKGVLSKGKVKVQDVQPGVFTTTQNGKGDGTIACQLVLKDDNGNTTSNTYPAPPCMISADKRDSYLLIFGTGFRNTTAASVTVQFGTGDTAKDIVPVYAGAQNQFPGLDQINLLLPTDLTAGKLTLKIKSSSGGTAVESNSFDIMVVK